MKKVVLIVLIAAWNGEDDNKSVDGSEHSLHIDLPEDKTELSEAGGEVRRSPFLQYSDTTQSNSSQPPPGMLWCW